MTQPKIVRSDIYQSIFDDEFMQTTFGTLRPTVEERTKYFFDCWMDWRDNRAIVLVRWTPDLRQMLNTLGLREMHDYQIRNKEIRFKRKEDHAMAMLAGLKEFVLSV